MGKKLSSELLGKVEPELTRAGESDLVLNVDDGWFRIDNE